MKIIKSNKKLNKYGIRKYSSVESESTKGIVYTVGKVRVRNSRNYKYICTCPDNFYRQRTCKHIKIFKEGE